MDAAHATSQADDVSTADAAAVLSQIPLAAMLGITVDEVTPERVTAAMSWAADRCTTGGIMHGGALMTFADTIGALCAVVNLPPASSTSTIESKTNFFRAVRGGVVTATCSPLHVGRTTIVVQTNLTDDRGKLVAQVTQTQAVLAAPGIDAEAKSLPRA